MAGLPRITATAFGFRLTETTCQASYPLNSENESPFGTFTVYLSCAEMAQLPTKASTSVIIEIVSIPLPFIASTSFIKFSVLTSLLRANRDLGGDGQVDEKRPNLRSKTWKPSQKAGASHSFEQMSKLQGSGQAPDPLLPCANPQYSNNRISQVSSLKPNTCEYNLLISSRPR